MANAISVCAKYANFIIKNVKYFGELNMKKTAIAAALLMVSGAASAAPITQLTITGGDFAMAGAGGTINPAAFADMTVGGYDGSAPLATGTEADYAPVSIATFAFGFFGPVSIYTAETDGLNSGFAAPTGDITGNNLTLDLSSWTAYWNGTSFNQGSSSDLVPNTVCVGPACSTAIATTYDSVTGDFTATWDAVVVGGAFNGQLASWSITGTASAVPVPAAVWLFGTGLLGLAGIARRRKAA